MRIPFEFQKTVATYRLGLYLPQHKLAIELDEHNHTDRNEEYEATRDEAIKHLLSCNFIRANPDDRHFNIALFLADITRHIFSAK